MTYWSPSWIIDQALHAKHDSSLLCKGEICFYFYVFLIFNFTMSPLSLSLQPNYVSPLPFPSTQLCLPFPSTQLCLPSPFPFNPIEQTLRNFPKEANHNLGCKIEINRSNIVQMLFLGVGLFTLLGLLYLSLCEICRLQYQFKPIE